MRVIDFVVIVIYLLAMPAIGIYLSGKQRSSTDYFVGDRKMPWWAVTFSVVATETSVLTVISVPTVAYLGSFTYLQLAIGYLIGRVLVAFVLLPRYYAGNLVSAYGLLGKRFGRGMQGTASVTFLITRLLADGLRLFATAIPVQFVLRSVGVDAAFWQIILAIALFSVIYTYVGGIKAVIWVDVIQMALYVGGAVVALFVLFSKLPADWFSQATAQDKFQLFDFSGILTNQYQFITAVVGGALFAMASHGADQLMVQRLLACKNVRDSQKAVMASGVVVMLQFALFLFIGTLLWRFFNKQDPQTDLGLTSDDQLFPKFIVEQLPPGISGLLIAGILAAAMSTISSSLNSLSTSTVSDLYQRFTKRELPDEVVMRQAKIWTLVWAGVFVVFASLFTDLENPVVEVGLSIASYTYGALLGAFFLALLVRRANQADAVIAFLSTIAVVAVFVFGVAFTVDGEDMPLAFPWYTPLGVIVTLVVGGLLSLRHRDPTREPAMTSSSES